MRADYQVLFEHCDDPPNTWRFISTVSDLVVKTCRPGSRSSICSDIPCTPADVPSPKPLEHMDDPLFERGLSQTVAMLRCGP
jgi:hypothetical protein